jgi:hypothetical protein
MKGLLITLFSLFAIGVHAQSDALLKEAGSEIDFTKQIVVQKAISLDNPFLIQLYTAWKAAGTLSPVADQWMQLVFDKKYLEALKLLPEVKDGKIAEITKSSELYLLHQLGLVQSFLTKWIELASEGAFLTSQMGIALDQIIGKDSSRILIRNGFFITPTLAEKLAKIEAIPSQMNYSLQALKALRTGSDATKWIGKLEEDDALRVFLAKTSLLQYAKEGKLGASGKLIKSVIGPWLEKSGNDEEIALYFLTLARLLYQANAFAEASKYYDLIPESSQYFLKARSEALWIYLVERNFPKLKGELATLKLGLFDDKFYPEVHLASAMASVMVCEFVDSKQAINRFVQVNKNWVQQIDQNLKASNPAIVETNFFTANLERARGSLAKEIAELKKRELEPNYLNALESKLDQVSEAYRLEAVSQWKNRQKILEEALYKMKFVKVELITRMRKVALKMKQVESDEVSLYRAAPARDNQISFPNDGVLWGDELFQMSAEVKNLCLQGMK